MSQTVLHGDNLEIMPTMRARSYGAVVTDPPYHLTQARRNGSPRNNDPATPFGRVRLGSRGFMGKTWDGGDAAFRRETWQAVIRLLMPGGYMVAFGGTRTHHRLTVAIEDAGFEIVDCLMWLHGQGFPKGRAQLKPAWEPIILARRPSGRVLSFNIDGCRVDSVVLDSERRTSPRSGERVSGFAMGPTEGERHNPAGRWPANVILDETSAAMLDEQSGILHGHGSKRHGGSSKGIFDWGTADRSQTGGESGGASRFFYCPKASRSERGAYNDWATVKPIALMRWLVRLIGRKGWPILDPFCGSGTTLLACMAEGFDGTGIDNDPHAIDITRRRLAEREGRIMAVQV